MTGACFALIVILSLLSAGCEGTDVDMALQAGADAVRAATLDDEGVHRLAVEVASRSDREHAVAPPDNPHAKRLERLTGGPSKIDGYELDCNVYLSPKVNAFAMADGTIRVYSGLMEMMTDFSEGDIEYQHIRFGLTIMEHEGSCRADCLDRNSVGTVGCL